VQTAQAPEIELDHRANGEFHCATHLWRKLRDNVKAHELQVSHKRRNATKEGNAPSECLSSGPIFETCREMVPQDRFKWNGLQLNVEYGTVRHRDVNNLGPSLFARISGKGALALETGERFDSNEVWYQFRGNAVDHWTEPFDPKSCAGGVFDIENARTTLVLFLSAPEPGAVDQHALGQKVVVKLRTPAVMPGLPKANKLVLVGFELVDDATDLWDAATTHRIEVIPRDQRNSEEENAANDLFYNELLANVRDLGQNDCVIMQGPARTFNKDCRGQGDADI
jgi:hypothetical protein